MKIFFSALVALMALTLATPPDAEAKRFGGGLKLGKQYQTMPRSTPPRQSQQAAPNRSQAARTSGASRWLGPLAGLAAGGLLASLFFGDAFEGLQIMDILLIGGLVVGGMMLFTAMRRRGAAAAAGAGAYGAPGAESGAPLPGSGIPSGGTMPPSLGAPVQVADAGAAEVPAWFNGTPFLDGAKTHFIRLQAAWDRADFRDIREYTTPQLFAELQQERQRLGSGPQYTEVVTLDAEIVAVRRDGDQAVASILFSGLIREEESAAASPFREIWHVQHEWDAPEGDWFVAGIRQA